MFPKLGLGVNVVGGPVGTNTWVGAGAGLQGLGPGLATMSNVGVHANVGVHVALPPQQASHEERHTGVVTSHRSNFGFIKLDGGSGDMFVTPGACSAFGGKIPPAGTRCNFTIIVDMKTQRQRAHDVRPIPGEEAPLDMQQDTGVVDQTDLVQFGERWGLGDDARKVLLHLDADVQYNVMMSFAPKNEAGLACSSRAELGRDCDGKFILFARGVEKAKHGTTVQAKGLDKGKSNVFGKAKGFGKDPWPTGDNTESKMVYVGKGQWQTVEQSRKHAGKGTFGPLQIDQEFNGDFIAGSAACQSTAGTGMPYEQLGSMYGTSTGYNGSTMPVNWLNNDAAVSGFGSSAGNNGCTTPVNMFSNGAPVSGFSASVGYNGSTMPSGVINNGATVSGLGTSVGYNGPGMSAAALNNDAAVSGFGTSIGYNGSTMPSDVINNSAAVSGFGISLGCNGSTMSADVLNNSATVSGTVGAMSSIDGAVRSSPY